MPSKSRRGQRKLSRTKKGKSRQSHAPIAAQQQATAQIYTPVTPPKESAPSAKLPTRTPTQVVVRHPYVITELRAIGTLAGIILVILVVLAMVLP